MLRSALSQSYGLCPIVLYICLSLHTSVCTVPLNFKITHNYAQGAWTHDSLDFISNSARARFLNARNRMVLGYNLSLTTIKRVPLS